MLLIDHLTLMLKRINPDEQNVKGIISSEVKFSALEDFINEELTNIDQETISYIEMSMLARYHQYMIDHYPTYKGSIYELFKNIEV